MYYPRILSHLIIRVGKLFKIIFVYLQIKNREILRGVYSLIRYYLNKGCGVKVGSSSSQKLLLYVKKLLISKTELYYSNSLSKGQERLFT